jgi:hypothetical protein
MGGRKRWLAALGLAALLATATTALAGTNAIDDVTLTGGGATEWEPATDDTAYCTSQADPGFAAVDNGVAGSADDAFDGGLEVLVDNKVFVDGDGDGTLAGQALTVGADPVKGLDVAVFERALEHSPTLQVLYGFINPGDHALSRNVTVESNLGSDTDTTLVDTSDGNKRFTPADRWVVTKDASHDDPPVTHVLAGKGGHGVDKVLATPGKPCEFGGYKDAVIARYGVKVPPHSKRYLLVFAEMNEDSVDAAVRSVKKFNDPKLSDKLLKGISGKVQHKILNWDF